MTDPTRLHELLQAHLDGVADESQRAELAGLVAADREAAELFALVTRLECRLAEHFAHEHGFQQALATLGRAGIDGGRRSPAPSTDLRLTDSGEFARPGGAVLFRIPKWAYAAAAVLAVAVGLVALGGLDRLIGTGGDDGKRTARDGEHKSNTPETTTAAPQLVRGSVWIEEKPSSKVIENKPVEVAHDEPALIELADGSRAELEPSSEAVFRGRVGEVRQVIELNEGAGSFRVAKGGGQFRIDTILGSVTALGTEFTVGLQRPVRASGGAMKTRAVQALAVAVIAGVVRVDFGGRQYELSAGDNQVFAAEEGEGKPRSREVKAVIAKFDPVAGSLTLKFGGENAREETFNLTRDLLVLIDGRQAKLTDLSIGMTVAVKLDANSQNVTGIAAEGPSIRGKVASVDGKAGTITLAGEGGAQSYTVNPEAKIALDGKAAPLGEIKAGTVVLLRLSADRTQVTGVSAGLGDKEGGERRDGDKPAGEGAPRKRIPSANGLFRSVTGNSIVITVSLDGGDIEDRTFTLAPEYKVLLGERTPAAIADLKPGARVVLRFTEDKKAINVVMIAPDKRRDGVKPPAKEGDKPPVRDGEKPPAKEGDKPREAEKPRDGVKPPAKEGDKPREAERKPDGEKPVKDAPRREKPPVRDGEKPPAKEGDKPREGERKPDGEKPAKDAPRREN